MEKNLDWLDMKRLGSPRNVLGDIILTLNISAVKMYLENQHVKRKNLHLMWHFNEHQLIVIMWYEVPKEAQCIPWSVLFQTGVTLLEDVTQPLSKTYYTKKMSYGLTDTLSTPMWLPDAGLSFHLHRFLSPLDAPWNGTQPFLSYQQKVQVQPQMLLLPCLELSS